jgi:hypothetical protein
VSNSSTKPAEERVAFKASSFRNTFFNRCLPYPGDDVGMKEREQESRTSRKSAGHFRHEQEVIMRWEYANLSALFWAVLSMALRQMKINTCKIRAIAPNRTARACSPFFFANRIGELLSGAIVQLSLPGSKQLYNFFSFTLCPAFLPRCTQRGCDNLVRFQ